MPIVFCQTRQSEVSTTHLEGMRQEGTKQRAPGAGSVTQVEGRIMIGGARQGTGITTPNNRMISRRRVIRKKRGEVQMASDTTSISRIVEDSRRRIRSRALMSGLNSRESMPSGCSDSRAKIKDRAGREEEVMGGVTGTSTTSSSIRMIRASSEIQSTITIITSRIMKTFRDTMEDMM